MRLGKVIRELDVELDEERIPAPETPAPEDEPHAAPDPAQPANVPA
jgi:hypothetical protein